MIEASDDKPTLEIFVSILKSLKKFFQQQTWADNVEVWREALKKKFFFNCAEPNLIFSMNIDQFD